MRTIESGRGAPGAAAGLGAGRIRGTNRRGRHFHLGVTRVSRDRREREETGRRDDGPAARDARPGGLAGGAPRRREPGRRARGQAPSSAFLQWQIYSRDLK